MAPADYAASQQDIDDEAEAEEEEEEEEEDVDEEEDDDGADEEGGNHPNTSLSSSHKLISAVSNLSSLSHLREIGKEALCWQLSSAKPGNGVEQIRDGSIDSYWQSDGTKQPHWIQVHFARRVAISHVCLYLDYQLDESYTPKKIAVEYGMTNQDLQAAVYPDNTEIEFQEPTGWVIVPLSSPYDPSDECCHADLIESENSINPILEANRQMVRTHMLRISILSMHQNGRDTHIRQVELYGPRMRMGGDMKSILPHPVATTVGQSARILGDRNVGPPTGEEERHEDDDDNDFGAIGMPVFGGIR